jgi:hypothetical protein
LELFPSQSQNWNLNNMLKNTKNTPFNRVQHFIRKKIM